MGTGTEVMQKLLPLLPILVPLAVHFILTNFVLESAMLIEYFGDDDDDDDYKYINWLPLTFLFSHFFFFITGLWTLQDREGILPVCVFIFVVVVSGLNDIIQLGLYFGIGQEEFGDGDSSKARTWQFSAGMMILNLMGKPLTIGLAVITIYLRIGGSIPGMKFVGGGGGGPGTYEPVPSSGGN